MSNNLLIACPAMAEVPKGVNIRALMIIRLFIVIP